MAGKKSNISKVDRLKELEKLLKRLRKDDTKNNIDVDLILKYLQNHLGILKLNSTKLMKFEQQYDMNSMSIIYTMTWRQTDLERAYEETNK